MIADLVNLISLSLNLFKSREPRQFEIALLFGVLLGGLCWLACSRYSRLWNLRFRVTLTHHVLCFLSALLTLAFSVTWRALDYSKQAAEVSIGNWEEGINRDTDWRGATFQKAWLRVRTLGLEDFQRPNVASGDTIPVTKDESRTAVASVYGAESVAHFRQNRPFLSRVLKARAEVPSESMNADVKSYFSRNPGKSYDPRQGVALVAKQVKSELELFLHRVIPVCKSATVALFLLVQSIPFGLVGFAAYHDINSSI
jgi:hypothetical protein